MRSGGSPQGNPNANYNPTNSQTTPYGNATPTNYQWQSFLPESGTASAQLGDPSAQRFADGSVTPSATSTPLLPSAGGAGAPATTSNAADMRNMIARMIAQDAYQRATAHDSHFIGTNEDRQRVLRSMRGGGGAHESASGGSRASGSFGGGGDAWGGLR